MDFASRSDDTERVEVQMEAVTVSLETPDAYLLYKVMFQPQGTARVPKNDGHTTLVQGKDADWAAPYIPHANDSHIKPDAIYGILNRNAARKILSGHLLAIRYHMITRMRETDKHLDVASRWEKELKYSIGQGETSLTRFTAYSYKALTDWLETSPAQLIASIEGVSVTTIRNRIYAAREIGAIEKPGAGVRSANRPTKD